MKVAVKRELNRIIDLFPDGESENSTYIVSNGYIVLDIEDPILASTTNEDGTIDIVFRELNQEDYKEYDRINYKSIRDELVKNIVVVHNGIEYQGDEDSQSRMSRTINGLQENGTIEWKAKDNSKQILSILDLKEILYLAGQEQTRIWFNE